MKSIFAICIFLFSMIASAIDSEEAKIGIWCESDDGGETCFGYETFYNDGTVIAEGELTEYGIGYKMNGVWSVKGNTTCMTPLQISSYDLKTKQILESPPVEDICSTMISIDDKEYIYRNSYGKIETMYKVTSDPNKQLN
jgi:hypothetical protein